MRWLILTIALVVAVPAARADRVTGRREVAEALARRDVATIQSRAIYPLQLRHLWFDTDACKKFSGDSTEVAADQIAELVGCLGDLGVQPIDNQPFVAATYGPGALLAVMTTPDGKELVALASIVAKDGAPIIHPDVFAQHIAQPQREVAPDATTKKIIEGAPGFHAEAQVMVCSDATGIRAKSDAAAKAVIVAPKGNAVSSPIKAPAAYGELIDKALAAWKLAPFVAHGKPVRACGAVTLGYPANLLLTPELPSGNPFTPSTGAPPPPPPPPAPPNTVSPTVLEGIRISGEKNILPDDATKDEILRSKKTRVIGAFKLCVDATGKVDDVKLIKSTGYGAYDRKLEAGMWTWVYKPYLVNGKAVKVCTAVTFIYGQALPPLPKP
jgi:hypothetical protein